MSEAAPRIWVLLGHRQGDNNQLLALAEALGLPFETRSLRFNALRILGRWLGASLASLDGASRRSIAPPWPDLVIGIGWRSVPVARFIKRSSGGRTRLVRLGHPRAAADLFDLILTTPQYPVPPAPNVVQLPLGFSRFRTPPAPDASERRFLDELPRPHLLLAVGGAARYWRLSAGQVLGAAAKLAERAHRARGSLIVVTSPRTPDEVGQKLQEAVQGRNARLVAGPRPRFPILLDDADEIFVTGDSVAMLSEAALTGKPVGLVPVELSAEGERKLGKESRGRYRDLRHFWQSLRDHKLAGTIDAPAGGAIEDPAARAAAAVRALLGDRVE